MGKNLSTVLAGEGVTVNTVSPGDVVPSQILTEDPDSPCNDWFYRHDPDAKRNVSTLC